MLFSLSSVRTVTRVALFAAALAAAPLASAVTLDFSGAAVGNYNPVAQTYGDTATVNLSYRTLNGGNNWGPGAAAASCTNCDTVEYWNDAQYSGDQAIFSTASNGKLEVRLDAGPGLLFSSIGFQLGSYPNTTSSDTEYRIYDGAGNLLASLANATIDGAAGLFVSLSNPNVSTIVFQMGDIYNRGVNYLTYETVAAVPLPASAWLLLSALMGLLVLQRRRSLGFN